MRPWELYGTDSLNEKKPSTIKSMKSYEADLERKLQKARETCTSQDNDKSAAEKGLLSCAFIEHQ